MVESEKDNQSRNMDELMGEVSRQMTQLEKIQIIRESKIQDIIFEGGKIRKMIVVKDCIAYDLIFPNGTDMKFDDVDF
jgi:hypothetical protein